MKYNRLLNFQQNSSKLSRYRIALSILYDLGIDQLLIEMGAPLGVDDDHTNIVLLHALQNQRALGYRECIERLFSLDTLAIPTETTVAPDYGAIDVMIKDGLIRQEDVDEFMKEV